MKRPLLLASALLALVVIAILVLVFRPAGNGTTALPDPNGYDFFLEAGQRLKVDAFDLRDLTVAELKSAVEQNREALDLVREGLKHPSRVVWGASREELEMIHHPLARMKALAQLLQAEGHVAQEEDRPADAAQSFLDLIRLGHELGRGGPLIFRMVGMALERMAAQPLEVLIPKLEAAQCREVAAVLLEVQEQRETWEEIQHNERLFEQRYLAAQPFLLRFSGRIGLLLGKRQDSLEQVQPMHEQTERTRNQIMLQAAERASWLETVRPPAPD